MDHNGDKEVRVILVSVFQAIVNMTEGGVLRQKHKTILGGKSKPNKEVEVEKIIFC
ncbi:hypothetical protein ACFLVE_03860 [Chloroflexota bacterium]